MTTRTEEQVLAGLLAARLQATDEASTRPTDGPLVDLARDVLRLYSQLVDVAATGDAALADPMGQLWNLTVTQRASGPDAPVVWADAEPIVLATLEMVGRVRQTDAAIIAMVGRIMHGLAPLLALIEAQGQAQAAARQAVAEDALLERAAHFPIQ